ncbi:hypothetical protein BU24DRAFT_426371 [Aaosphaeria arxii CBS 175.79]|uniref:Oxo-4-hydroxy-4-carboxy-5-ureidoimidazoline decarboxylase domain-containing protein n=1 Tax=Aaosphaeria arxii CBS 175.79 TaxID=1450172 RepID=A0A6A5XEG0_9PLEO|nr:uncharacterized protein BU24DRAFT_426371 [Aaosphaeria arxii CBS 175.79]KAF2011290.1 hypothetical protein BU24DRAFT_426371 [Aaosphaeria arxii CBS 175.79]
MTLPPPSTLPTLPHPEILTTIDLLFEPSPRLHSLLLPSLLTTPHESYASLIASVHSSLTKLSRAKNPRAMENLIAILGSHPRLGAKKVESAQSRAEQASLAGGEGDGGEEGERLRVLNEEYEEAFPGLRYVVFVNARSREEIMRDMRERIDRGNPGLEMREAIDAMCDIARDRVGKLGVREE